MKDYQMQMINDMMMNDGTMFLVTKDIEFGKYIRVDDMDVDDGKLFLSDGNSICVCDLSFDNFIIGTRFKGK